VSRTTGISPNFVDKIVKCSPEENRRLREQGSPLFHVRADAPPFFVVHGAQHAFDGFQSVRCGHVINVIERFTTWVRTTSTKRVS